MHGIVSMTDWLRDHPGASGLVLANGGWMTKEAVGIWSTARPDTFSPVDQMAKPSEKVVLDTAPQTGTVETYTVTYGKDGPMSGIIFGRTDSGARFIAAAAPEAMPRLLDEESPVGLPVAVTTADERNTFTFV